MSAKRTVKEKVSAAGELVPKRGGEVAEVERLEAAIDAHVFRLYGLTAGVHDGRGAKSGHDLLGRLR